MSIDINQGLVGIAHGFRSWECRVCCSLFVSMSLDNHAVNHQTQIRS